MGSCAQELQYTSSIDESQESEKQKKP